MISDDARREIDQARGPSLTMLIEWTAPLDLAPITQAATRTARVERLQAVLRSLKGPLLDRLGREEGVEVVDIGTAPQAIVRASPERWRELATPGEYLASVTDLRVVPNVLFQTQETAAP